MIDAKPARSVLYICTFLFAALLLPQATRLLPVLDWNYEGADFANNVREVQSWLGIEDPAQPKIFWPYYVHGHAQEVRSKLGNHIANDLLKDGLLTLSYTELEGGGRIAFDSRGFVSIVDLPAAKDLPDLSAEEAREQRIAFVKAFCARPDIPFDTSNIHQFTRKAEYEGVEERVIFGKGSRRISYCAVKYFPEEEGPPRNYPDYIGLPKLAWSVPAMAIVGITVIAIYLLFLRRLKMDAIPVTPFFLVSLLCLLSVAGCFLLLALREGPNWPRSFFTHVAAYLCVPFLLTGLLGYGWSLDRRLQRGRALQDFSLAFVGRLPVKRYLRHLGAGFILAIWIALVYAGVLLIGSLFFEVTFRPQPQSIFRDMLWSSHPLIAACFYFVFIAIAEESLYRLCCQLLLWKSTGRKWLAVAIPALVFALAHLPFLFLGPEHPLLLKVLACFSISIVWGIAFFRMGFLPVVISHLLIDVGLAFYFFQTVPARLQIEGVVCLLAILGLPVMLRTVRRIAPLRGAI